MARPFVALLALCAASLIAFPAAAQWKWKDKSGHVQYSDLPPPNGTPEADILARPAARRTAQSTTSAAPPASVAAATAASAASVAAAPRTSDPELEAKRKKAEAEVAAKSKAEQDKVTAAKADNCARAKAQLGTLESGIRIAQVNAKTGEREFLDDTQRQNEAKRTRDVINADCK